VLDSATAKTSDHSARPPGGSIPSRPECRRRIKPYDDTEPSPDAELQFCATTVPRPTTTGPGSDLAERVGEFSPGSIAANCRWTAVDGLNNS
jgi:hypothetical protein